MMVDETEVLAEERRKYIATTPLRDECRKLEPKASVDLFYLFRIWRDVWGFSVRVSAIDILRHALGMGTEGDFRLLLAIRNLLDGDEPFHLRFVRISGIMSGCEYLTYMVEGADSVTFSMETTNKAELEDEMPDEYRLTHVCEKPSCKLSEAELIAWGREMTKAIVDAMRATISDCEILQGDD